MKQGEKKPTGAIWEKQKRFCDEYLVDFHGTKAAIRAGYSDKAAPQISSRLLTYDYIQDYLREGKQALASKLEITREMIAEEYRKIGFSNITDCVRVVEEVVEIPDEDENGEPIKRTYKAVDVSATDKLSPTVTGAIASIKQTRAGIEVTMHDKRGALDSLCKMFGFNAPEKQEISGPNGSAIPIQEHRVVFTDFKKDGK